MKVKKLNISDLALNRKKESETEATPNESTSPSPNSSSRLPVPLQKLKAKWDSLSNKQQYAIIGLVGFTILAIPTLFIYRIFTDLPERPSNILNLTESYLAPQAQADSIGNFGIYTFQEPSVPRTEESPLNGKLFTKEEYEKLEKRLPVAVMVNNHAVARPQSSLTKADLVYETLVESGITRYMPIFWSNNVEKVGPIRSARQQYIEWLSPFDAIFLHDGYASSDDPKVDAGGNLFLYSIKTLATFGAWREFDGRRFAPHNEYTSVVSAWEEANRRGWGGLKNNTESWEFKPDALMEERGDRTTATIQFHTRLRNSGLYDAKWTYDKTSNSYLREIGGQPDIDQEINEQIRAKVVILQTTNTVNTFDAKAHVIVETIGSGKATILQDGKVLQGTWKKDSRTDRTTYYDSNNKPVQFNRGLIWISVVSQTDSQFDIMEQ